MGSWRWDWGSVSSFDSEEEGEGLVSNESIWGLRGCLEQGCLGLRRVKHVSFVFVYSAQPHDQNGLTHVPLHKPREGDDDNADQNRPLIGFNILLADTQGIPSKAHAIAGFLIAAGTQVRHFTQHLCKLDLAFHPTGHRHQLTAWSQVPHNAALAHLVRGENRNNLGLY